MAEYCIVFVDSDGWSYKEMEPVFEDLEAVKQEARARQQRSGLPVLGVADREAKRLVYRTDGQDLDIPHKFQVWPTD